MMGTRTGQQTGDQQQPWCSEQRSPSPHPDDTWRLRWWVRLVLISWTIGAVWGLSTLPSAVTG